MRMRESGFHLWIVIVIIAFVGVAGLLVWRFIDTSNRNGGNIAANGGNFGSQYQCDDKDVSFTSGPLKMNDLGYIRPLGAMLDGHVTPTDHVYVGPTKTDVPDNTYPVLMPADGKVVEVSRMPSEYIGDRDFTAPKEDHRLVIMFSCRYFSIFIHVHKLADSVQAAAGSLEPNQNKMVSVALKAGDTVGYIGGDTFDWTPIDTRSTLTGYIHPDLYKTEAWKVYTVSPFDLYTGDIKTQLEAKSWRTTAPIGGRIDYDQAGKLIGNWFREGTNGYQGASQERYWDGHLAVVPDYIDPQYTIVSIGNWDGKAHQFVVDPNVDPSTISTDSGVVKMQLKELTYTDGSNSYRGNTLSHSVHPEMNKPIAGTILFEVLSGEKLKVETFVGQTEDQVTGFTDQAQVYER